MMESSAPYRTLDEGEMLNWYRIERILGRGGFGVIYLARDINLDLEVAIKEYMPGDVARRADNSGVFPLTDKHGAAYSRGLERFIEEARNLVRFKHPNIVRVMSVFQENNTAYMVMELEEGVNFREYIATAPGARDEESLKGLVIPIIEGLEEVHSHGFIHRDIKPSNILIRQDSTPVLLDFGSARNAGSLTGQNLTALVSAGYAPLEQYDDDGKAERQQGPWTDIYALGGVLYHAVSTSDPVDSTRRASAVFNGGRDPLLPATLVGHGHYDEGFLRAIDWALSFRIADRPQSLGDWVPALLAGTRPAKTMSIPLMGGRKDFADAPTVLSARSVADGVRPRRNPTSWSARIAQVGVLITLLGSSGAGLLWVLDARSTAARAEQASREAKAAEEAATAEAQRLAEARAAEEEAAAAEAQRLAEARAAEEEAAAAEAQRLAEAKAAEEEAAAAEAQRLAKAKAVEEAAALEAQQLADARAAAEAAAGEAQRAAEARAAEDAAAAEAQRLAEARAAEEAAVVAERAKADKTRREKAAADAERLAAEAAIPVSDADIATVMKRFEALRLAIVRQEASIMNALTEPSSQNRLFEQLMDDFTELDVALENIRVRNADKSIAATLRIQSMIRGNGDRAEPSDAYRDREIIATRRDGQWSPIVW